MLSPPCPCHLSQAILQQGYFTIDLLHSHVGPQSSCFTTGVFSLSEAPHSMPQLGTPVGFELVATIISWLLFSQGCPLKPYTIDSAATMGVCMG